MYDKYKPPSEQQFQRRDKGYSDASTKWNHDRYFDLERERKQERNQRLDREYDRRHTDRQNTDRQNIINSERSRNTKQEPKYDKNQERSESNSFHHPRHNNDNNNSRDQLQRPTPSKRHREDERHHEPTRAPSQNRDRDRNQDHTDSKFNRYYRDERGDGAKRELHERIRIRSMSRQPIIRRANVRIESYTSSYSSSTPSSAPLGKRCSYDDRSNQDERTEKRKESSIRQQDNNRSRNDYDSSKYNYYRPAPALSTQSRQSAREGPVKSNVRYNAQDTYDDRESPVSLIGFSPLSDVSIRPPKPPKPYTDTISFNSILELAEPMTATVTKSMRANPALKPLLLSGSKPVKMRFTMKESTSKAVSKPINSGKSKKAVNSTGVKKGKSSSNPNPVITTAKVTRTSPCRSATSATTDTESSASELMHMALPLPCEERICEEVNFVDIGDDLLQWLTTDWLTDFDRPSSLLVHPTHSTVVHTTPTSSSTSTDSGKERMVFVMGIATDFLTPAYWTKPVDY